MYTQICEILVKDAGKSTAGIYYHCDLFSSAFLSM